MSDYIPYAELEPWQRVLVDAPNPLDRANAAARGWGSNKLVSDEALEVRREVARAGDFLDTLAEDPASEVRAAVAEQGAWLGRLMSDPVAVVRREVARQCYGLAEYVNDPSPEVRAAVAEFSPGAVGQAYVDRADGMRGASGVYKAGYEGQIERLRALTEDPSPAVRKAVAQQGFALDKLIRDVDLDVSNTAFNTMARDGYPETRSGVVSWVVDNPDSAMCLPTDHRELIDSYLQESGTSLIGIGTMGRRELYRELAGPLLDLDMRRNRDSRAAEDVVAEIVASRSWGYTREPALNADEVANVIEDDGRGNDMAVTDLHRARREAGYRSAADFAEAVGANPADWQRWESTEEARWDMPEAIAANAVDLLDIGVEQVTGIPSDRVMRDYVGNAVDVPWPVTEPQADTSYGRRLVAEAIERGEDLYNVNSGRVIIFDITEGSNLGPTGELFHGAMTATTPVADLMEPDGTYRDAAADALDRYPAPGSGAAGRMGWLPTATPVAMVPGWERDEAVMSEIVEEIDRDTRGWCLSDGESIARAVSIDEIVRDAAGRDTELEYPEVPGTGARAARMPELTLPAPDDDHVVYYVNSHGRPEIMVIADGVASGYELLADGTVADAGGWEISGDYDPDDGYTPPDYDHERYGFLADTNGVFIAPRVADEVAAAYRDGTSVRPELAGNLEHMRLDVVSDLQQARRDAGYRTADDFARSIRVRPEDWARWEQIGRDGSGDRADMPFEVAQRASAALSLPLADVMLTNEYEVMLAEKTAALKPEQREAIVAAAGDVKTYLRAAGNSLLKSTGGEVLLENLSDDTLSALTGEVIGRLPVESSEAFYDLVDNIVEQGAWRDSGELADGSAIVDYDGRTYTLTPRQRLASREYDYESDYLANLDESILTETGMTLGELGDAERRALLDEIADKWESDPGYEGHDTGALEDIVNRTAHNGSWLAVGGDERGNNMAENDRFTAPDTIEMTEVDVKWRDTGEVTEGVLVCSWGGPLPEGVDDRVFFAGMGREQLEAAQVLGDDALPGWEFGVVSVGDSWQETIDEQGYGHEVVGSRTHAAEKTEPAPAMESDEVYAYNAKEGSVVGIWDSDADGPGWYVERYKLQENGTWQEADGAFYTREYDDDGNQIAGYASAMEAYQDAEARDGDVLCSNELYESITDAAYEAFKQHRESELQRAAAAVEAHETAQAAPVNESREGFDQVTKQGYMILASNPTYGKYSDVLAVKMTSTGPEFAIGRGYDTETGEWGQGMYCNDLPTAEWDHVCGKDEPWWRDNVDRECDMEGLPKDAIVQPLPDGYAVAAPDEEVSGISMELYDVAGNFVSDLAYFSPCVDNDKGVIEEYTLHVADVRGASGMNMREAERFTISDVGSAAFEASLDDGLHEEIANTKPETAKRALSGIDAICSAAKTQAAAGVKSAGTRNEQTRGEI